MLPSVLTFSHAKSRQVAQSYNSQVHAQCGAETHMHSRDGNTSDPQAMPCAVRQEGRVHVARVLITIAQGGDVKYVGRCEAACTQEWECPRGSQSSGSQRKEGEQSSRTSPSVGGTLDDCH